MPDPYGNLPYCQTTRRVRSQVMFSDPPGMVYIYPPDYAGRQRVALRRRLGYGVAYRVYYRFDRHDYTGSSSVRLVYR